MNSAKLAIFVPQICVSSEIWVLRQLEKFNRFSCNVVAWEKFDAHEYPLESDSLDVFGYHPDLYQDSWRRWFVRLCHVFDGNYFATCGNEAKRIESIIREKMPDVILCHFGHTALKVINIARKLDVPLVAHFHGLDVSSMLRNKWYEKSLISTLDKFAAIVVVGSQQKEWMIRHGVQENRVHLIPCGAPVKEMMCEPCRSGDGITVIGVGRLVEQKGIEYTIKAVAGVISKHNDVKLKLLGDGPELENMKMLAIELGIEQNVEFAGSVDSSTVHKELTEADIFVQHSLNSENGAVEGFGVSVTEAMACALPVVATKCGGIMDQVVDGETGFLVEQRNADEMSAAIEKLIADKQLRTNMGRTGQKRALELFDTDLQIGKLENVLLNTVIG